MTGRLVLVVGASGAGKARILRYATAHFAGDARFVFPRRCITRVADASAEDHESVDERTFDKLAGQRAFAMMWEAHGHKYGVRSEIDTRRAGKQWGPSPLDLAFTVADARMTEFRQNLSSCVENPSFDPVQDQFPAPRVSEARKPRVITHSIVQATGGAPGVEIDLKPSSMACVDLGN